MADCGIGQTTRMIASTMFALGVAEVLRDLRSTNHALCSFVVSVYVLGYAIGFLELAIVPVAILLIMCGE
jgi:riboflavin transporter FmnP